MTMKQAKLAAAVVASLGALLAMPAHAGKTLDAIKSRGQVVCGVNTGLAGFAAADSAGKWSGMDVDVCRALAAATLSDPEKVKYVPLNAQQRFTALQSGTTTEKNLTDYSKANALAIKPVVFEKLEAAENAYFTGRCIAYTTDASGLASTRNKVAKDPKEHMILPELISKEPLGPMVRRGDDEWFAVVKWVMYGLIEAEEYGVTQTNVEQMKASTDPVVQRLLGGGNEDTGKLLGLDKAWLARAIAATGNYGEIFERNVGPKSPLALPRGLNNQWNKGGLMYAYPVR